MSRFTADAVVNIIKGARGKGATTTLAGSGATVVVGSLDLRNVLKESHPAASIESITTHWYHIPQSRPIVFDNDVVERLAREVIRLSDKLEAVQNLIGGTTHEAVS